MDRQRPLHWSFYGFLPCTVLVLFLDSSWLSARGVEGQWLANMMTLGYFAAMMRTLRDPPLQRAMWLAVVISAAGEIIGSMGLEIWVYRKEYVPLYVPLGHAIVIGCGFQILRLAGFQRHHRFIVAGGSVVYAGMIVLAVLLWGDTLSLVFGVLFALALLRARNRLLYMFMPVPVLFVELVGTALGCWHWPPAPFGWLSTTNPPVGSIALYVALDMSVLFVTSLYLARRRRHGGEGAALGVEVE